MTKTILITGSSDGIGLETAKRLAADGHHVLLHGRSENKLTDAEQTVREQGGDGKVEWFVADLSRLANVVEFADQVIARHDRLDVLINNAGVFKVPDPSTPDGLDVRFAVNTIAPYLLTKRLLALFEPAGRVVNLSSAAQAPVDVDAMSGHGSLDARDAYAQSKLALTMWSRHLALEVGHDGPAIIAVNPGSLLGTKMVKEGFGMVGKDVGIGADVLIRAALSDEFASASGTYFDNDSGRFADPHPDALDPGMAEQIVRRIAAVIEDLT